MDFVPQEKLYSKKRVKVLFFTALSIFLALCLITALSLQFQINEKNREYELLQQKLLAIKDVIDEQEYQNEREMDTQYAAQIAAEKLNMYYPTAILIKNNSKK